MKRRFALGILGMLALTGAGCDSSPTAPDDFPSTDDSVAIGSSTLIFSNAAPLADQRGRIEEVVRDTYEAARSAVPLEGITIIIRAGTTLAIPEIGLGGRADAGTVRMDIDPGSAAWPASLDTDLGPVLAHEMHHVARLRSVGFPDNLLEAVVLEGLADHFLVELTGAPPAPWAVALQGEQLQRWVDRASEVWLQGSYDHDAWFFGSPEIPRWAGYAIGFEVVRRRLATDSGATAADLYDAPAESFLPG